MLIDSVRQHEIPIQIDHGKFQLNPQDQAVQNESASFDLSRIKKLFSH